MRARRLHRRCGTFLAEPLNWTSGGKVDGRELASGFWRRGYRSTSASGFRGLGFGFGEKGSSHTYVVVIHQTIPSFFSSHRSCKPQPRNKSGNIHPSYTQQTFSIVGQFFCIGCHAKSWIAGPRAMLWSRFLLIA